MGDVKRPRRVLTNPGTISRNEDMLVGITRIMDVSYKKDMAEILCVKELGLLVSFETGISSYLLVP